MFYFPASQFSFNYFYVFKYFYSHKKIESWLNCFRCWLFMRWFQHHGQRRCVSRSHKGSRFVISKSGTHSPSFFNDCHVIVLIGFHLFFSNTEIPQINIRWQIICTSIFLEEVIEKIKLCQFWKDELMPKNLIKYELYMDFIENKTPS